MRQSIYQRIQVKKEMQPKLSILIPTLKSRFKTLKLQVDRIEYQRQQKPVQLLWLGDNKSITVGTKRNLLLDISMGEYVCFVDDDDIVSANYVESILKAIEDNPTKKVFTFLGEQNDNGTPTCDFRYSIEYGRNHKRKIDGKEWKVMLPDHLCIWKKDIIKERFPNKQLGEDHDFAQLMTKHYTKEDEFEINECLYFYDYNRSTTECR